MRLSVALRVQGLGLWWRLARASPTPVWGQGNVERALGGPRLAGPPVGREWGPPRRETWAGPRPPAEWHPGLGGGVRSSLIAEPSESPREPRARHVPLRVAEFRS